MSLSLLSIAGAPQLRADTPVVNDTTTGYGGPSEPDSAPCFGTCDFSPSYSHYVVPFPFRISKITFNWFNVGGNNCDGFGHYGAVLSTTPDATGIVATSNNSVYIGCAGFNGGTSGVAELDFSGQTIPASFYLDFASVDGGLQGGSITGITHVQVFATQSGVPVYAPPGQIIQGFPVQLILDPAPILTCNIQGGSCSYLIDYGVSTLYVVEWSSSIPAASLFASYEQYLPAAGWGAIVNETQPLSFGLTASNNGLDLGVAILPQGSGSSVTLFVEVPAIPAAPQGLSAVVGNGIVHLRWDAAISPPMGYNVYVNGVKANSVGLISNTGYGVTGLQNTQIYQFGLTAVGSGGESNPATIFAVPNAFVAPAHPLHPILFLHGINADATAWETTTRFLRDALHWSCGGTLAYHQTDDPTPDPITHQPHDGPGDAYGSFLRSPDACDRPFSPTGDFFTVDFGDNLANYTNDPDSTGIFRQGDEVGGFIRAINYSEPLSIVAWSMGGLAARSYMQVTDPIGAPNQISDLVTLGTPHWGVDRNYLLIPTNPLQFLLKLALLPVLTSRGLIDMDGGCVSNGDSTDYKNQLSEFLQELDFNGAFGLPERIRYVAVSGLSYVRPDECANPSSSPLISTDWVVPSTSATFAGILPASQRWQSLTRPDVHSAAIPSIYGTAIPDDFTAILCALDPNCLELQVMSPVDIQVTAPSGLSISPTFTSIPGADYTTVTDATGHETATVLIPFPQGGQYAIAVTPKPGAQPTDTFTILQTQAGVTTTIASNMQIAAIPSSGFQTAVKDGSKFTVNFGGNVQQPLKNDGLGHVVATVTITNQGNVPVDAVQIAASSTTLGTASLSYAPAAMTNLVPGGSAAVALTFPITAALSTATSAPLKISGTYSAGTLSGNWSLSFRSVTLAH